VIDIFLQTQARRAIADGRIPGHRPGRTSGGRASTSHCPVCAAPLKQGEVVLEVEFPPNGEAGAVRQLHIRCYVALEDEWNIRESALTSGAGQQAAAAAAARPDETGA
jgi:hypothetical protein